MKTDSISNQLRWVILLLSAAVILPTVCLLWFMDQAVKNEYLAVSTKLSSILNNEVYVTFEPFLEWVNSENLNARKMLAESTPFDAFSRYAQSDNGFASRELFIYDIQSDNVLYPCEWDPSDTISDLTELQTAMHLEYAEENLNAALDEYKKVEEKYPNSVIFKHCIIGQARIYQKQGNTAAAIITYERALTEPLDTNENWNLYASANLKILYLLEELGFEKQENIDRFNSNIQNLLYIIDRVELFSCEQRIFFFQKLAELAEQHDVLLEKKLHSNITALKRNIDTLSQSLTFLSEHPDFLKSQPPYPMLEEIEGSHYYALNLYAGSKKVVRLIDIKDICENLSKHLDLTSDIYCRILNSDGNVIVGPTTIEQEAFLKSPITSWLDLTVEFYDTQEDSNVFLRTSRRQASIYIWTGFLMVVFVLAVGGVSIRTVNRQIKMNRLKNDFIATVTHELKTPLSSMRLLVDTLLEGRYEDEKTVPEYLGLIATENKRLSHLIDSFLTFSRMERNKQVFDFQVISPKDIADAGVEAARAKLHHDGCDFSMEVGNALPNVKADKDAMVTVLVNLLENACKYSGENKQIALNVFEQNGNVYFIVQDNGIGISKRAQKRIFNRFYQVDSHLSRSAEGCGLGLSIVKFIVDAHKGRIEVESQPGQGSTFTVKLPKI